MAKTPSDKLYRLIRSLTAAEKRYFSIYIRGKTERDSKYLQLFEALDATRKFNEVKVIKRVYKDEIVTGKKYSELKAYLYDLILKCLQSFDEQQSVNTRLNQILQGVAVLFKRGHYDDCMEQLHKARRLAEQFEMFSYLLDVVYWEKQLAYSRMDVDHLQKKMDQWHYEESHALDLLRNIATYRMAFFKVYTTIKKEAQFRGEDRLQQLKKLIDSHDFEDIHQAMSHRARVYYLRTLNLYYYAASEPIQFYESGKQMIELIESRPHFLRESISDYIAGLSNLILSCGMTQKYDEVEVCLHKLRDLRPITEDDRRKIHRQYYSNLFALYTYTGRFEEARVEMQRCQDEAAGFDPQDYETFSFYYQYVFICFGCGDYDTALDYLNQWLNQPRSVEREDLQSVAHIMLAILHFEMGNFMLLESILRNTTRFLKKKNRFYDIEERLLQGINDLTKQPSARAQIPIFKKIKDDLAGPALKGSAKILLQTFDLNAWINSKLMNKTFAETVQNAFKK